MGPGRLPCMSDVTTERGSTWEGGATNPTQNTYAFGRVGELTRNRPHSDPRCTRFHLTKEETEPSESTFANPNHTTPTTHRPAPSQSAHHSFTLGLASPPPRRRRFQPETGPGPPHRSGHRPRPYRSTAAPPAQRRKDSPPTARLLTASSFHADQRGRLRPGHAQPRQGHVHSSWQESCRTLIRWTTSSSAVPAATLASLVRASTSATTADESRTSSTSATYSRRARTRRRGFPKLPSSRGFPRCPRLPEYSDPEVRGHRSRPRPMLAAATTTWLPHRRR